MSKHNKKRNTGFIYEALVREVVKQSVGKNKAKRNQTIAILRECFGKSTLLYQDLHLYKSITDTKDATNNIATKILNEARSKKAKINKKDLFREQSLVISKINKKVSSSVFTNYVPNYKYLASIGMFLGDSLNPKQKVLLEEKLIENMMLSVDKKEKKAHKMDNVIVNSFLKRFNNTYADVLLNEQKELLNKYINSATSEAGVEFKLFVDREIDRLRSALDENKEHKEVISDSLMGKKFEKVLSFLNESHRYPLDESFILKITQIQQLVNEITTND